MIAPVHPGAPVALSALTHLRWSLPVLAHVARQGGCKLVTLSRQLGIAPPSLRRTLVRLEALELVVPNPGYGHPQRPEYVLGAVGQQAGELAEAIVGWAQADAIEDAVYMKWQLPVLLALDAQTRRFGELRQRLDPATPRALSLALKRHASHGLVARCVEELHPPVPLYTATPRARPGREAAGLLAALLGSA